jgi:hypothetical protein
MAWLRRFRRVVAARESRLALPRTPPEGSSSTPPPLGSARCTRASPRPRALALWTTPATLAQADRRSRSASAPRIPPSADRIRRSTLRRPQCVSRAPERSGTLRWRRRCGRRPLLVGEAITPAESSAVLIRNRATAGYRRSSRRSIQKRSPIAARRPLLAAPHLRGWQHPGTCR